MREYPTNDLQTTGYNAVAGLRPGATVRSVKTGGAKASGSQRREMSQSIGSAEILSGRMRPSWLKWVLHGLEGPKVPVSCYRSAPWLALFALDDLRDAMPGSRT